MARHRDFDAARAEQAAEPLTFTLGGTEFTAVAELPAAPLLDLARLVSDPDSNQVAAIAGMVDLLHGLVVDEQRDVFLEVLRTVPMGVLIDIVAWLIEESTGRPLPSASSSPPARSEDGPPSRVVSLSPGSASRSA